MRIIERLNALDERLGLASPERFEAARHHRARIGALDPEARQQLTRVRLIVLVLVAPLLLIPVVLAALAVSAGSPWWSIVLLAWPAAVMTVVGLISRRLEVRMLANIDTESIGG